MHREVEEVVNGDDKAWMTGISATLVSCRSAGSVVRKLAARLMLFLMRIIASFELQTLSQINPLITVRLYYQLTHKPRLTAYLGSRSSC